MTTEQLKAGVLLSEKIKNTEENLDNLNGANGYFKFTQIGDERDFIIEVPKSMLGSEQLLGQIGLVLLSAKQMIKSLIELELEKLKKQFEEIQ